MVILYCENNENKLLMDLFQVCVFSRNCKNGEQNTFSCENGKFTKNTTF